jgi:hypothetical protein
MKTITLLATTAIAIVGFASLSGCGFNPDPTELNVHVSIRNNLKTPVRLMNCKPAVLPCQKTVDEIGVLQPDEIAHGIFVQIGVPNPVLVLTTNGKRLGCLPLDYKSERQVPDEVAVSQTRRC